MLYLEHNKLNIFSVEQMNALNEFCEYLDNNVESAFVDNSKPLTICAQDVLYDFLGVNKVELEKERAHMLKLRNQIVSL